jgi:hypothetical protein
MSERKIGWGSFAKGAAAVYITFGLLNTGITLVTENSINKEQPEAVQQLEGNNWQDLQDVQIHMSLLETLLDANLVSRNEQGTVTFEAKGTSSNPSTVIENCKQGYNVNNATKVLNLNNTPAECKVN